MPLKDTPRFKGLHGPTTDRGAGRKAPANACELRSLSDQRSRRFAALHYINPPPMSRNILILDPPAGPGDRAFLGVRSHPRSGALSSSRAGASRAASAARALRPRPSRRGRDDSVPVPPPRAAAGGVGRDLWSFCHTFDDGSRREPDAPRSPRLTEEGPGGDAPPPAALPGGGRLGRPIGPPGAAHEPDEPKQIKGLPSGGPGGGDAASGRPANAAAPPGRPVRPKLRRRRGRNPELAPVLLEGRHGPAEPPRGVAAAGRFGLDRRAGGC